MFDNHLSATFTNNLFIPCRRSGQKIYTLHLFAMAEQFLELLIGDVEALLTHVLTQSLTSCLRGYEILLQPRSRLPSFQDLENFDV